MPSAKVMHEFKAGALHSGGKSGPVVKNRKQAIAIMLSEKSKEDLADGGDQDSAPARAKKPTRSKR